VLTLLMLADTLTIMAPAEAVTLARPSRSTTLALTRNDRRLVVVNRETNSVSVIEVVQIIGGVRTDVANKLAEITVGQEPRCVALRPDDQEAYVTNTASGTVSVLSLETFEVVDEIPVGTEPRGCAITPNGLRLYVANHTEGTISIISLATRQVVNTVTVGGNPSAIAITNDLDEDDTDERVFVTDFFARIIPGGPARPLMMASKGVSSHFRSAM
jgi:YVTN family beta-propeller protein